MLEGDILSWVDAHSNLPPGKVDRASGCGSKGSNQAGSVDPPHWRVFLFSRSAIDAALIQAYRETEFRVLGPHPFTLRVGDISPELAAVHQAYQSHCSTFITASNPYSKSLEPQANADRHEALRNRLEQINLVHKEGIGQHSSSPWPAEASFLVVGMSLEAATALGKALEQNAIVWSGEDARPELVLLR